MTSAAGHVGVQLMDSTGKEQLVFTRLFNYAIDNPEIKDMVCLRGGHLGNFNCEICFCPSASQLKLSKCFALGSSVGKSWLWYEVCDL